MTPAVTVVIPAFNAEGCIGEALASIADQTLREVEAIVVDDGSTDATLRVVERYASRIDLRVIRQQNRGPSAARNAGIRLARGRHCAFLDADDVMLPERLEVQSAMLDADPELGLVLTDVATFDERGTIHPARWASSSAAGPSLLDWLLVENFVTTSAVMAPTSRFLDAGLFDERRRVAEDYELWLRMADRWKMAFVDRPLVRYRYTSGSLSSDKLFSARCALEVIEAFWTAHDAYARRHPQVHHRSLARHLANAGAAAIAQGAHAAAFGYLGRSLRHLPSAAATWKTLAKALLRSSAVVVNRPQPQPSESS